MTRPLEFVVSTCAAWTSFVSSTFASLTASPEILSVTMMVYRAGMRSSLSSSCKQAVNKALAKIMSIMEMYFKADLGIKFVLKIEIFFGEDSRKIICMSYYGQIVHEK